MSTRIHAKAADVLVDEFLFDDVTNSVEIEIENTPADVTAFADTDKTYAEGKAKFTINLNGLLSNASQAYDGEMFIDLTSENRQVGVYPEGSRTAGNPGYEGQTDISQAPRVVEKAQAILLNVTWQGDKALARARILHSATAIAASANGTAYQHGAITATQEGVGVLRLIAAPGGAGNNTCIVKIQSDDNSGMTSPTDRITFATLNQASVALHEVLTVAGAITDDYWRAVVTIAGAGSRTFNIIIAFGIRKA